MKKFEILKFYKSIITIQNKNEEKKSRFTYALVINKNKLEPIVNAIEESKGTLTDKEKEFITKRDDIIRRYAKNENGMIYVPEENKEKFLKETEKIEKEYKEEIISLNEKDKSYNEMLNEEYEEEINILKVSIDVFPEKMNDELMNGLLYMIKEE